MSKLKYDKDDLLILKVDKKIIRGWAFDYYKDKGEYCDDDVIEILKTIWIKGD